MSCRRRTNARLLAVALSLLLSSPALGKIELVGTGRVPGSETDFSGLNASLGDGTPHNRLGSIGSGIAYTGRGARYVMISDRGPKDGATDYKCRFHVYKISVIPERKEVRLTLLSTRLLRSTADRPYVGQRLAFDGARLDPEGVRVGRHGSLYVADEYGPLVLEFDRDGMERRKLRVPERFLIANPGASAEEERPPHNIAGRQSNRGMEGLAISPDGSKLYGIMQSCLIQDGQFDEEKQYVAGRNVRLLEMDTTTGATREFVYPLEDERHGVNEIVAVNGHEFLVLERDSRPGLEAEVKRLYHIDISGATDVSDVASLPENRLPEGVAAVKKAPFLDLLDRSYGLAGSDFPEKIEGLAFGPDLPDGRHLLLVTTDNDFRQEQPTRVFAFAIDPDDLPGYEPQVFADAERGYWAELVLGVLMIVVVLMALGYWMGKRA